MLYIENTSGFSPKKTFESGQCFRFSALTDGSYRGVAFGRELTCREEGEKLCLSCTREEYESHWKHYLALDYDYSGIEELTRCDGYIAEAYCFGKGIHILRQEPWEALCSFILSQRCNIPRIKGMVAKLCENFGEQIGEGVFAFPSAERLAETSEEELAVIRAGYRADYVRSAAIAVASGMSNLEKCAALPTEEARKELMKLRGVGKKVADCALLYGLNHGDAFPVDVWMNRALSHFDSFDSESFGADAGLIQQYLFYYITNNK